MDATTLHRTPASSSRALGAMLALAVLVAAFGAVGCGDDKPAQQGPPPTFEFPLEVSVTDQKSEPLPGAPVLLDGNVVGYTDRDGKFGGTLTERPGASVELRIGEIDGYAFDGEPVVQETLEVKRSLAGDSLTPIPVSLQASAVSTTQRYLLWVELSCDDDSIDAKHCADLPILRNGEEIARTNEDGRAKIELQEEPGQSFTLKVETPEYIPEADEPVRMLPEDPVWEIDLSYDPEILLLNESFKDPVVAKKQKKKKKKRRRRYKRSRAKKRAKKKKEKKEESGDIINLF